MQVYSDGALLAWVEHRYIRAIGSSFCIDEYNDYSDRLSSRMDWSLVNKLLFQKSARKIKK